MDADESRLRERLENLFRNAVEHGSTSPLSQASEDGDSLTVTVGQGPNGVFVADDGVGIPPSDRESVFETGVSTAEDGMGLALAIVDEIAEAHGWTVTLTESTAGGARFEFACA